MLTIISGEQGRTLYHEDASLLPHLINDTSRNFWLDLQAPTPEEFALLRDVFHFHPLALEDASRPNQRPKIDEYEGYCFLAADEVTLQLDIGTEEDRHAVGSTNPDLSPQQQSLINDEDDVQTRQIGMFFGGNYLVTVHIEPAEAVQTLRNRCDNNVRLLERGPDFVLYTLLDILTDSYFPLMDKFDEALDELESRIFKSADPDALETIFALKRDIARIRRYAGPLRQVVEALTERNFPNVNDKTLPYLRDVADHLFRIYESLDNYRDLAGNLLDAHLSQTSNRMNRIMQKLSVISAIFLPLTFLTGFFGMNFTHQAWADTNPMFWMAAMIAFGVATHTFFRRRNWI